MRYQVWIEGHVATGDAAESQYLGEYEAATFQEACKLACVANYGQTDTEQYYDAENNTFWGCKLVDNADDAKTFDNLLTYFY